MFKSLLRTIPTISGNFTLACKVNNYITKNNIEYTSYIDDAILMPLDNKYSLTKNIQINLPNSKYEYDIMKYYKEISSYFYDDTYLKNQNIFEQYSKNEYNLPDNRDKNFEFGCKRISYNKYQYQYQFFAPIYINSVEDLPDSFVINIYSNTNVLVKQITIPITSHIRSNKLRIYLTKYIQQLEDNVPVIWNFGNNKIIYQKAIDCIHGGFVNFTSFNTIQNNNVNQTIINDIDNLICQGYKHNGIIMSECIPLSFIFNINDILQPNDLYYYYFNQFTITGYYIKNGIKCDYYDFSYNYHNNYNYYINYENDLNRSQKKLYNLFDNNIIYSLKEGTNYSLYYQNTFKKTYFQWKLNESKNYIININTVYSYNMITNKFPILKNSLSNTFKSIIKDNNLYLPINNYSGFYNDNDQTDYSTLIKNNYTNWFNIYTEHSVNTLSDYLPILNKKVFFNGVDYEIDEDIKYFNVFINPIPIPYNDSLIKGNVIVEINKKNNTYDYLNISNNYYEEINDIQSLDDEDKVYIKDYFIDNIYYILHSETLSSDLYNSLVGINKYKNILNGNISKVNFISILEKYFNIISGYDKLDVKTEMFNNQLELFNNFFKNHPTAKYQIYYSKPNTTQKNNLYYDLNNKVVDYDFLLENNIIYFKKTNFIKIGDYKELNNIIFNDDNGLYTLLYNNCYITTGNKNDSNDIIDELKNILCQNAKNDSFEIYSFNIKDNFTQLTNQFNLLFNLIYQIQINNDLLGLLIYVKDIVYYYIIFQLLDLYIHNQKNYQLYNYIPYNNQNNIQVNNEYYEKVYNNLEYQKIYCSKQDFLNNQNLKNKSLSNGIVDCYVYIDNFETFDYFRKLYGEEYINENIYNKEYIIDFDVVKYKLYKLNSVYLSNLLYMNNRKIKSTEIMTNQMNIYKLLSKKLKYKYNQAIIDFDVIYNENGENSKYSTFEMKFNLYIKLTGYTLNSNIWKEVINNSNIFPNCILYKEDQKYTTYNNKSVITCNIIYNNISKYNHNPYEYQIIKKNLITVGSNVVYQNPYNTLLKLTYKEYKVNYGENNITLYTQSKYINNYDIRFERLEQNPKYGYLCIDYYFMISTNALNVYNIDDNDNFIISKINDISIVNYDEDGNQIILTDIIKSLFKNIYPYLKQDLFLELLNYQFKENIHIILPHTIKCNINTIVKRKTDNNSFTNINLSENIIKKIYLNRYFGNISPLFNKVSVDINYERSKIYIISNNKNINVNSDNNNVLIENINIYQYNPINYYSDNKTEIHKISQIEYKHFNNNKLFVLPNELTITPSDIDYIQVHQLKEYENEEKCFEYFKEYLDNNYLIKSQSTEEKNKEYYFLFKKYTINYIHENDIMLNGIIKNPIKIYKISYKLILT